MTADPAELLDDEERKWSAWAIVAALLLLILFGAIGFGTIRGCFFADPQAAAKQEEEDKKKKKDEEKKEFILSPPIVMPAEPKSPLPLVKPGHWETVSQDMLMNYRDLLGDSRMSIVDSQGRPFAIPKTPFTVRSSRPVALAKARKKSTETTLFIPEATQRIQLASELEERGIGLGFSQAPSPLTPMPSYQYNFVVLAKEPLRYSFLKSIDCVKVPFGGENENEEMQDFTMYTVVPLVAGSSVALPDNPLTWTSIAYILWDDVDPGEPISPDQKKALVDWIHWGGQLVISGPNSLDLLKGSFLEPYLPATSGGPEKIEPNDPRIAKLNEAWNISTKKAPGEPLKLHNPWSAVKLVPVPGKGIELPGTGGLLVERQVGRGRIVVSAMQLKERDLLNWRSGFEGLFNACILRREPRQYLPGIYNKPTLTWADKDMRERRLDAALNTRLRYFSRDLGVDSSFHHVDVTDPDITFQQYNRQGQPITSREYKGKVTGGMAAWNDFSATANAARSALREAAGVEVPNADFVVLCLALYLAALVPLNWVIFRAINRVEWAWIAAPIIALVGTWIIVQRAQLDIGFVRAQTEIGILEQQPDHPRAHLSRYTALYTSLSSTYDFQSDNGTTLIAPFPTQEDFQLHIGEGLTPINFQKYDDVRLTGLPISSNSTGMAHTEQMQTLEGAVILNKSQASGSEQIVNGTKLDLHSACIFKKLSPDEAKRRGRPYEGMWIGDMRPGESRLLSLNKVEEKKPPFYTDRDDEAKLAAAGRLNLEPMFQLALDPKFVDDGETRFVARVDEVLPGEAITPDASQVRGATLVVAHLKYAPLAPPRKDVNTKRDITDKDDDLEAPDGVIQF